MKSPVSLLVFWFAATVGWVTASPFGAANPFLQEKNDAPRKQASLVKLTLPLGADAEARVLASLEAVVARAQGGDRPVVVLEFVPLDKSFTPTAPSERLGRGTSFERALTLARWLSGPKGNRIRSIAYLPESIGGHAVLIALACEEIAMDPAAELGLAGMDDAGGEATIKQAYAEIAGRRGLVPAAAVRSMLDPSETLVQFMLEGGGSTYATLPEMEQRLRPENAFSEKQLVPANQMGTFTGQELRTWRWITHLVPDRDALSSVLKLDTEVKERPAFAEPRTAMRAHVRGIVNARQVDRTIRAIEDAIDNHQADLVLIEVDSPGGNLSESLRLAYYLANVPSDKAEVVVFVSGHARGDASLIAMAADTVFMAPNAVLGGAGEATITVADIEKRKENLIEFSKLVGRFPGDVAGCLSPETPVFEYQAANGRRMRAPAKWIDDDPKLPLWVQGPERSYAKGLDADQAIDLGIASDRQSSVTAVGNHYGLESLPEEKQTNTTEQVVEWVASQRWLSMFLFMVGMMCLIAEINTPGLGVPGALATVCFLLFFWLNLFQGTVEWLEILLILGGIACLAVEIFVLPGFGVFGVSGLVMLAMGLILAGQTFVVPTNAYQTERVIYGLGQLGFGMFLLLGLLIGFRKQLAKMPMLRWFALQPPTSDRFVVSMDRLDEDRRSLLGCYGSTVSRCNPFGKAMIGDQMVDVVSEHSWIDEGTPIEVVAIEDNRVLIKQRRI
jgi:membrane-bound ClpP family serine protease